MVFSGWLLNRDNMAAALAQTPTNATPAYAEGSDPFGVVINMAGIVVAAPGNLAARQAAINTNMAGITDAVRVNAQDAADREALGPFMKPTWVPTGPVPMGYHPALAAYVKDLALPSQKLMAQKQPVIQAGSVVIIKDQGPGSKRKREDAVEIIYSKQHMADNELTLQVIALGPNTFNGAVGTAPAPVTDRYKYAFAIDDILAEKGVMASLQTYGLLSAMVTTYRAGADNELRVGAPVYPLSLIHI